MLLGLHYGGSVLMAATLGSVFAPEMGHDLDGVQARRESDRAPTPFWVRRLTSRRATFVGLASSRDASLARRGGDAGSARFSGRLLITRAGVWISAVVLRRRAPHWSHYLRASYCVSGGVGYGCGTRLSCALLAEPVHTALMIGLLRSLVVVLCACRAGLGCASSSSSTLRCFRCRRCPSGATSTRCTRTSARPARTATRPTSARSSSATCCSCARCRRSRAFARRSRRTPRGRPVRVSVTHRRGEERQHTSPYEDHARRLSTS